MIFVVKTVEMHLDDDQVTRNRKRKLFKINDMLMKKGALNGTL